MILGALIAAFALATPPAGGMRLLAKHQPRVVLQLIGPNEALTKNGADAEAIQNQVEVALRKCGFAVVDTQQGQAWVLVSVLGMAEPRGYAAEVMLEVRMPRGIEGEFVFVDAYTDGQVVTGSPDSASQMVREALNRLLDAFCNEYLAAREQVRKRK